MSMLLVNVTSAALIDWLGSAISGSSIVQVAVVDCISANVILSNHGIRGSSIGSGGGSLPVPSQRGQSISGTTAFQRNGPTRWVLPSTSVTLCTSTLH